MKFFGILILTTVQLLNLLTASEKEYIILHCREGCGMFSIFHDVLSLVKCYDQDFYSGIEVNFMNEGLYYSEEHGENWWTYYCEPIQLGVRTHVRHVTGDIPGSRPWEIEKHTSRHEAKRLIDKYIRINPEINKKISKFQKENFENHFVVSVHYRGTDKFTEAPIVYYNTVAYEVHKLIQKNESVKIFIATDEQSFLNYMIEEFGDLVCYNPDAIRSVDGNPIHTGNFDRYKCGLDAILDSVLLSKGQYLIRTSSNLSRWSTFFNPDIPVLELNESYAFHQKTSSSICRTQGNCMKN